MLRRQSELAHCLLKGAHLLHRLRRMVVSRWIARASVVVLGGAGLVGCGGSDGTGPGGGIAPAPTNLRYTVEASGTPGQPSGVLLQWDGTLSSDLKVWNVYSRPSSTGGFRIRGSTTSRSFDDRGAPDLEYYVTAEDVNGRESGSSNVVQVSERLKLQSPATLTTTSLNSAIALAWTDNAYTSAPGGFSIYRVYSTTYDLDRGVCASSWTLEGTSVSPEFVAASLTNGVSRCFGVSAVSVDGFESLWSPLRNDTPRPDARNVVVYARQFQSAGSAFRFWQDLNGDGKAQSGELGRPLPGSDAAADFAVDRDASGALFLVPVRTGTAVAQYGTAPSADLTSIDIAPKTGYSTVPIQALPGWGYVFQMNGGDGFARYGGVRVSHVGRDFLILDWSYQTDAGNPELLVGHP